MKKTSIIILLVLIITGLFVACNGDAANSVFGEEELPNVFCFTALEPGSTVKLESFEDTNPNMTAELHDLPAGVKFLYSTDATTWIDYTIETSIALANANDKVYFKAKEKISKLSGFHDYYHFTGTGKVSVQGNIMYLLDPSGNSTEMEDYAFASLFKDNTALVSATDLLLSSEALSEGCFLAMFSGCTSLTDAPELNATVLGTACYQSMFYGCTSLTKAPVLPATVLANNCYECMFLSCEALTTAPQLSATTLADDCYKSMFYKCANLATAPVFDVTVKNNLKTNETYASKYAKGIFYNTLIPQSDFNAKCFAQ